ncbi:MAG: hypothetical protein R3213_00480 [Flavobacteriaceae bacterium]|nr:hypothetical protein [Flavobacteriaceae bacterium]
MRDHYITSMATYLRQFDNFDHSLAYYEYFAWEGLHQYLTLEEISNIQDVIQTNRLNGLDCE